MRNQLLPPFGKWRDSVDLSFEAIGSDTHSQFWNKTSGTFFRYARLEGKQHLN